VFLVKLLEFKLREIRDELSSGRLLNDSAEKTLKETALRVGACNMICYILGPDEEDDFLDMASAEYDMFSEEINKEIEQGEEKTD